MKSLPTTKQEREIRTKLGWALYHEKEHKNAERHWRYVVANAPAGDVWRGRSRWHLIQLSSGYQRDTKLALRLCKEQTEEFKGSFLGEQALFSQAWLLMVTKQWQESKEAFEELVDTYPRKARNIYVQDYIRHVETELTGKGKGRR